MGIVEREYFPVEKCLRICAERGVIDACAVLEKRRGNYEEAVKLLVEVLTDLS
jgi:sulfur relay (sulfurtransferase) complex TusBCD TusD component (DsrE family)